MSERVAACACGQLRVVCTGEPARISMCHCGQCQKRTGSLFGVCAFYAREQITRIEGTSTQYTRGGDSGFTVTFQFCPTCGTTLYWEVEARPNMIGVGVGAFDDPNFPRPHQAVWTERRHAWLPLPPDMPTLARAAVMPPIPVEAT
jgi:hypothetical protein